MDNAKTILEKKFNVLSPFEIEKTKKKSEIKNYSHDYIKKDEYNKFQKEKKIKKLIEVKNKNEKYYQDEIDKLLLIKHEKKANLTNNGGNFNIKNNEIDKVNYEKKLKYYDIMNNYLEIVLVILLIVLVIGILCLFSNWNYKRIKKKNSENAIQLTELEKSNESFSKISIEEKI